jgi:hypothetical protein
MSPKYDNLNLKLSYDELMEIAEVTAGLFALLERIYDIKLQELVR